MRLISSFEAVLERALVRLAANPALTAVVSITVLIVPLAVLRALLQVAAAFANNADYLQLAQQLQSLQALCFAMVPLLLNIYLALYYAARERLSPALCVTVSLSVLMMLNLIWLPQAGLLPDSIPLALVAGFLTNWLFKQAQRLPWFSTGSCNGLVEQSINHITNLIAVSAAAAAIAFLSAPLLGVLASQWLQWQANLHPTEFVSGMLYEFSRGVSWLFGVNGHHVLRDASAALQLSSQLNMEAWRVGEAPLNILSNTFFDVWCASGGSGSTLSLALCMLLRARSTGYRQLARASLPLAIVNVNEPLVFGVPVFFNPVMAIPFLFAPLTGYLVGYGATYLELVPAFHMQPGWMMPPLVNSWMASGGSYVAVALQLLVILLGALIYWPFFQWMEKRSLGLSFTPTSLDGVSGPDAKLDVITQRNNFISEMHHNFHAQKEVESLRASGNFVLFYQPQVALDSRRIVGVEALLRHQSHDGHIMAPTFIASFDRLGLMPELDFWVLEHAVAAAQSLHDVGQVSLAINLSPQTLLDVRLPQVLDRILANALPVGVRLEIEITESQLIDDPVCFAANLTALRARGLHIALDDFGSGYSTLAYLTRYPFDKIKLDRTLVHGLTRSVGQEFFAATVKLCRISGASVLAEGVETKEELESLATCGVNVVQGYYFYRPMPMADLLHHLVVQQRVTEAMV
ncbi:EAL domain-containing protein [Rhodobacteraceae bacterium CH30]|nr:EAL domain-containing protein [Rhodobacteraceae bacterium CH30]